MYKTICSLHINNCFPLYSACVSSNIRKHTTPQMCREFCIVCHNQPANFFLKFWRRRITALMMQYTVRRCVDTRLNGLVVGTLGIGAWRPGFDSRVVPLFHWITTLGRLLTLPPQFLSSKKLEDKREFSVSKWFW